MSTSLALRLPEIVSQILKYLAESADNVNAECNDALWWLEKESLPKDWEACITGVFNGKRKAIHKCILLNYAFFAEATSMLWAVFPPLSALSMLEPHRRQFYAGKIRSLCVYADWNTFAGGLLHGSVSFSGATFPKLRVLKVAGYLCDDVFASRLLPVLAPRLAELDIYGGQALDKDIQQFNPFFALVSVRCPELRAIRVYDDPACAPTAGLLASIDRVSSVTTLALKNSRLYKDDFQPGRLASKFQLCEVSTTGHRFPSLLPAVKTGLSSLKHIRKLTIEASATMITKHYQVLKHIEVLKIRLSQPDGTLVAEQQAAGNLLLLLSGSKGLRDLEISYLRCAYLVAAEKSPVTGHDLVILAEACQHLQRLKLDVGDTETPTFDLRCEDITEECLMFVASRLPELECFELYTWDGYAFPLLTVDSLRCFGEHCSKLRVLKLSGDFDYSALDPNAPCLFPHLYSFGKLDHEQYRKHKPFFDRHFPQLQEGGIDDGNVDTIG